MRFTRLYMATAAVSLVACAKQPTTTPADSQTTDQSWRKTTPEPLAERPFVVPEPVSGTLSNGIQVVMVENHEVPLVYVRLTLNVGGFMDPADRPGLASVTMDMLNEGANGQSAAEISAALAQLGSSLGSSAGSDGAQVALTTLSSKLEPSLDLMTHVALQPDFPADDWELMQSKLLQDLEAQKKDPNSINSRAWSKLLYGEQYLGHHPTSDGYTDMTTEDMKSWYDAYFDPSQAIILVGGDTTLAEIQPLLEARFGSWEADAQADPAIVLPTTDNLPEQQGGTIYLIDSPGAAQSVIRAGTFVGNRLDSDYADFTLANHVIGGQFSARINLNLREDKGWTYGARSWTTYNHLPGLWSVRTSVVTPHTKDAVVEIIGEIDRSLGESPITQDELSRSIEGMLGTRPLSFEKPDFLLDQTKNIHRYGLPKDWLATHDARFREVNLEQAQQAWNQHISTEKMTWVIVGDLATIQPSLAELGLPMVQIDADGQPVP